MHKLFTSRNAWPILKAAPDPNGMPDAWETAYKLNPHNAADQGKAGAGGYPILEICPVELAEN